MKQVFYNCKPLYSKGADYNILYGERSNGKSYSVKEHCVNEAYNNGIKLVYLRRLEKELKPLDIESYFLDVPVRSITKNEYSMISVYRKAIYLANMNEDGKVIRGMMIGRAVPLNLQRQYKSQAFPDYGNIIYEEFATNKGYLPDEPGELMEFTSTVFRRRSGKVWMIGNTVTRICPYYTEWGLANIPRQKQGTIDMYHFKTSQQDENGIPVTVNIAVEYCANSGNNSKMFFGKKEKSIAGGSWECSEHPNVNEVGEYDVCHEILLISQGFKFVMQLCVDSNYGGRFVYVYPYTRHRSIDRKITETFSTNPMVTNWFLKHEAAYLECFEQDRVCYSDNLTGEDFGVIMRMKGVNVC